MDKDAMMVIPPFILNSISMKGNSILQAIS